MARAPSFGLPVVWNCGGYESFEALRLLDGVVDVYLPDAKYGEEVMAWIKLRPGATLSEGELVGFCKGRMAGYKVPRVWKFVSAFPMTVTGKIQKFVMRQQAIDELGLQGAADTQTA